MLWQSHDVFLRWASRLNSKCFDAAKWGQAGEHSASQAVKGEVSQSERLPQQSLSRMERNHGLFLAQSLRRLPPRQGDAVGGSELLAGCQMWLGTEGSAQVTAVF